MSRTLPQLSLDVALHPALERPEDPEYEPCIVGCLKVTGELHCPTNLEAGDQVTITVANADGTVISQGAATATYPGFREIKDRGTVIGTERVNKVNVP